MKNVLKISLLLLFVSLLISTSCVKDLTPPIIEFLYPENNGCIWEGDTVIVVGTDNKKVSKIEFYINDSLVKSVENDTLRYIFPFPPGSYKFKAQAFDAQNNLSKREINVTSPSIIPSYPYTNAFVPDSTPRFSWQSMCNAVLYQIQVDMDSSFTSPAIDDSTSNTSYTPSTALQLDTSYYWRFRGKDSLGIWSNWSKIVKFNITSPPVITFLKPISNCVWDGDTIVVVATDNEKVSKIELYINDSLVKTVVDSDTLVYTFSLTSGDYTLKVQAFDPKNNLSIKEKNITNPSALPIYPDTNDIVPDSTPTFLWQSMCNAVLYQIQVDTDSTFASPVINDSTSDTLYTSSNSMSDTTTYFWRFRGKNNSGVWSNWSEIVKFTIISAEVLYYPFSADSGSVAYDSSGYGNDGTIYGAVWCSGISGNALSFDGQDDYVRNPSVTGFNFSGTNEITIEAWFYLTDHSTYDGIVSINDASGNIAYRIMVNPELHPFYDPGSGPPDQTDTAYTFNLNTWYHYVMTVKGGDTARIYINGTEIYKSPDGVPSVLPDGKDILIGCGETPDSWLTAGIIDEVKIYNRRIYK